MDTSKVNRVEVIDHTKDYVFGGGRVYTFKQEDVKIEAVLQDDERTLKIFISNKENENN